MQKSGEVKKPLLDVGVSLLIGTAVGMALTMLVMYISALAIYSGKLGESAGGLAALAASFIGACVGALIVVRRQGSHVLGFGALSGVSFFILILIFTAFGAYENVLWDSLLKAGICSVMGGLLGGVLCMPRGKKKKSRRSK